MSRGDKPFSGTGGSPINITYPRTSRKTTDETTRSRYTAASKPRLPVVDDDDNEDAWIVPKSHTSAYRYDSPYRSPRNATRDVDNPLRTKRVKQRRPLTGRLLILLGLGLFLVIIGVLAIQALGN